MKKSELKQLIKEIIMEQDENSIPNQDDILDSLYFSYKDNGLDGIEYNEAELKSVDHNLARNIQGWKILGNELIKFFELYGRKYELD